MKLKCPKCKGSDISVQIVQKGSKTTKSGPGVVGNAYNIYRAGAAVVTLGASNLFLPKAKGKEKTSTKTEKVAVCQECGKSWSL